ncbi:hypothetical protein H112_00770 [Trichophyton rubrum D6]|uniref:Uncharacterized protein n=3 Tax=Trichophyton TaxID=5550 RepID=A0A080WR98_TRIRC|nr:uncharacterized protein TERG_12609 [Trichophyton rubrum CBS 118892]EZF27270.1 hypothetical protein H100_00769 [Trichophyton rubrum MR850]EZF46276.1 hypothetical protein H102_00759 [Trichophyton rubrum CBS 100081]EZF56935.1 hypothetical protein H103_00766 [Trichophyton rubrum CBS 288.86]EZF67479.1 hypothetical protein H104_00753 [Trichophyton rubrum CBS 289.86]EZF78142.1 hypothetical protein H105_00763 [Trichophyton soudanense CBS 452.61]EZF88799.1 hypothetical protein H110_00769 [Trichophy
MYPLDIPLTLDHWGFLLGLITRKKEHERHLLGCPLHYAGASCAGWLNATVEPRFPGLKSRFHSYRYTPLDDFVALASIRSQLRKASIPSASIYLICGKIYTGIPVWPSNDHGMYIEKIHRL